MHVNKLSHVLLFRSSDLLAFCSLYILLFTQWQMGYVSHICTHIPPPPHSFPEVDKDSRENKWISKQYANLLDPEDGSAERITRYDTCSSVCFILHNALWLSDSKKSNFHSRYVLRLSYLTFYDSCQFHMSSDGGPTVGTIEGSPVWKWCLSSFASLNHKTAANAAHYLSTLCL